MSFALPDEIHSSVLFSHVLINVLTTEAF